MSSGMTYAQGEDSILGLLRTAWLTAYPTAPMLFAGVASEAPATGLWAKAVVRWGGGRQATLGRPTLWDRTGIVLVQLYHDGDSRRAATTAGQVLVDALEGGSSGTLWFTDVSMRDHLPDGSWQRVDVTASFEFQQLK